MQTKLQPETMSHPEHTVQTRDNNNISNSIKRKDTKQEKLHKSPIVNPPKKKLATKCPLQGKNKPTLCLQHRCMYIQCKYTKMIAVNGTRLVSKYSSQCEKGQSHPWAKPHGTIVIYITVTIYNFLMFFISYYF